MIIENVIIIYQKSRRDDIMLFNITPSGFNKFCVVFYNHTIPSGLNKQKSLEKMLMAEQKSEAVFANKILKNKINRY